MCKDPFTNNDWLPSRYAKPTIAKNYIIHFTFYFLITLHCTHKIYCVVCVYNHSPLTWNRVSFFSELVEAASRLQPPLSRIHSDAMTLFPILYLARKRPFCNMAAGAFSTTYVKRAYFKSLACAVAAILQYGGSRLFRNIC